MQMKIATYQFFSNLQSSVTAKDCSGLHKILFGRPGTAHEIKKNIRSFSGFPFDADSEEFQKKAASMKKCDVWH